MSADWVWTLADIQREREEGLLDMLDEMEHGRREGIPVDMWRALE